MKEKTKAIIKGIIGIILFVYGIFMVASFYLPGVIIGMFLFGIGIFIIYRASESFWHTKK